MLLMNGKRKPHEVLGNFFRSAGSVTAEVIEEYIRHSQDEWNFDFKDLKQKTLA
jgi:hypothetical protein